MNILSLFDGISCGMIALERAGIKVDKYYASEINEDSIMISKKNYPNIIQLGNVKDWDKWDIEWKGIDLVIGGSPFTDLSFSGKRKGLEGERSSLYYYYRFILNMIKKFNPNVKFLLENVKMEYLKNNKIYLNDIWKHIDKDSSFKFIKQILGYYYYVEVYKYKMVDMVSESANLVKLYEQKKIASDVVFEMVFHPNGNVNGSWVDNEDILL